MINSTPISSSIIGNQVPSSGFLGASSSTLATVSSISSICVTNSCLICDENGWTCYKCADGFILENSSL